MKLGRPDSLEVQIMKSQAKELKDERKVCFFIILVSNVHNKAKSARKQPSQKVQLYC